MDSCETPSAPDDRWSINSYLEMTQKLDALRSIVCDLLKTNQELRLALQETHSEGRHNADLTPQYGISQPVVSGETKEKRLSLK